VGLLGAFGLGRPGPPVVAAARGGDDGEDADERDDGEARGSSQARIIPRPT
jgi:hypothetical protein